MLINKFAAVILLLKSFVFVLKAAPLNISTSAIIQMTTRNVKGVVRKLFLAPW